MLATDLGSPWRPIAALVFLSVSLGASLVPLIGIRDTAMELMLVALSSAVLFYGRLWSPERELMLMFGLCLAGLVLQSVNAWTSRGRVTR